MQEIKVDIPVLFEKTEMLRESTDLISKRYNELISNINELDIYWQGNAATEFSRSFRCDIEKLGNYIKSIKKTAADYRYALKEYQNDEDKVSEIVNAIKFG